MHSLVTHGPHENGGARVAMSCTSRTSDPHDSTGTATTATASMTRSDHSTDQCTSNPVGLGVLSPGVDPPLDPPPPASPPPPPFLPFFIGENFPMKPPSFFRLGLLFTGVLFSRPIAPRSGSSRRLNQCAA